MNTIETPKGRLVLTEPSVHLLRAIRDFFPFGVARFAAGQEGANYGIVMQCDETELFCIKQQPPDCTEDGARSWFPVNSWNIAQTLPRYMAKGFSGLYLPCVYLRKKGDVGECGFAHFIYPSATGIESQEFDYQPAFDREFGHGATIMFESFCREQQALAKETKLPIQPTIDLDVRSRLAVGSLQLSFLCVGSAIVCLRTTIREDDPTWAILVDSGITEIPHMPSITMAIQKSDLAVTKGTPRGT